MMPYTDYTVRLGDLKRAIMKNPYDPNLNIDGYMRYLKYNTPPAQQWIPCSERYPDMDERVLVYMVANDYHVWDCMPNRADNYFWEDEDGLYHNKYEVDAWMPLPEQYRGEGNETD